MAVTEAQESGPRNLKKYCEYQVSKYGQKAARNAAPAHK